jgi:Sulfotransferase family
MEWRHTRWDEAQLVYTAIAKVANTSLKSALLASFAPDVSRTNPHSAEVPYETIGPGRIAVDAPDHLHFAFVRNPFDRFVSFWSDKIQGDGMNDGIRALGFDTGMGFVETVRIAVEIPDDETDPHIRSQSYLLLDHQQRLRPDLVLRFERIGADWDLLRSIVRFRTGCDMDRLPRRRVSEHKRFEEYYDDETRALIRERYASDFEHLNYERPPLRRRRIDVDDRVDALVASMSEPPIVLDLTPATIDRRRSIAAAGGEYLAALRHNRGGQLARLTALEKGRVPHEMFNTLIVDAAASDREPHATMLRLFEESGRHVIVV